MIKINRLYSEPELFEPIEFFDGINLILGEKDESSNKTNGVGKSLSIEFINYCLLKDFSYSRVSRMPKDAFPYDAYICLDFVINGVSVVSKRSIENHASPILIVDGKETKYFNIDDASKQLTNILFSSVTDSQHPSFRAILGPLMRDERSEFKSIIDCHDTRLKIPSDYTPHLYFFGIDPALYSESRKLQKEIDSTTTSRAKIKRDVETLTTKSFKDAKANLNELAGQVERVKAEMEGLESTESYEMVKDELIELEDLLEKKRTRQSVIKSELAKIKLFRGDNYIDDEEVAELYERFREGLGNAIKKEIQEVTSFKKKIDNFQKTLVEGRRDTLAGELSEVNSSIRSIDERYKDKLSIIDQKGALKSLKTTVMAYQKKLEEHSQLSAFIKKYDDYDSQIRTSKQKRSGKIILLNTLVKDAKDTVDAFQESILSIHEYVMGNRKSFFEIKIGENKEIVKFEFRIHDDGSHSNEREKVFFYDIAMLLTNELDASHPGFLVHDNIFDVDQDTLVKSLNYLEEKSGELEDKQYILTINSDKFHAEELADLKLNIDAYRRASFTKHNRFLRKHYQEL